MAPAGKSFLEAAQALSEASMKAYRKLVYETPGFTDYFFAATPIREIAELNIGSRPASRKATRAIEDLRAIPWGFSWGQFSHLANIAEDRHHVRRREHHERQGHVQEGSLAYSFERLAEGGVRAEDIARTLQRAYISPVLTAHPTEVQRKSILDAERAIAELIHQRDELHTQRELDDNEAQIRARVNDGHLLRPVGPQPLGLRQAHQMVDGLGAAA